MARDRTAQTEPLTTGQQIVARWESLGSGWSEPADLAEAIDAAIEAERIACADVAFNACLVPPDGGSPTEDERLMCERASGLILARSVKPWQPGDDLPF